MSKKYILITTEGYTFSPKNEGPEPDVENCQMLAKVEAPDVGEALKRAVEENPNLIELGFDEVIIYEVGEPFYALLSEATRPEPELRVIVLGLTRSEVYIHTVDRNRLKVGFGGDLQGYVEAVFGNNIEWMEFNGAIKKDRDVEIVIENRG